MNVAIFTDNDFAKVNGVTTTLRAVLEHAPPDVRSRVYTCEERQTERPNYLALNALGMGIPFYREMKMYLPPLERLTARVAADRIDVIHLTTPGPVGLAALSVASRLQVPLIGSFHTDLAAYARLLSGWRWLGRLMRMYLRWPYGRCERTFVPSEATRQTLIQGGIDSSKIEIWRRGVSTEQFTPAKRSAELRQQWGVRSGRLALLYVGRVSKEKGLDLLRPLGERLQRSGIDHRLIIVGDGPMRRELAVSCPGAVFMGTLTAANVAAAMASADVFVFPSRTDTAGNVVLEAQASGLPVLVTDEGGPQENMLDGETGHVCADVRAFARRITELTWNVERRGRLAERARGYAAGRQWAQALAPLYDAYRGVGTRSGLAGRLDARPAPAR